MQTIEGLPMNSNLRYAYETLFDSTLIFPRGKYLLILKEYGNNFRYYKRMNI